MPIRTRLSITTLPTLWDSSFSLQIDPFTFWSWFGIPHTLIFSDRRSWSCWDIYQNFCKLPLFYFTDLFPEKKMVHSGMWAASISQPVRLRTTSWQVRTVPRWWMPYLEPQSFSLDEQSLPRHCWHVDHPPVSHKHQQEFLQLERRGWVLCLFWRWQSTGRCH